MAKKPVALASKKDLLKICDEIDMQIRRAEYKAEEGLVASLKKLEGQLSKLEAAFRKRADVKKLKREIEKAKKRVCASRTGTKSKILTEIRAVENRIKLRGPTEANVSAVEKLVEKYQKPVKLSCERW